MGEFKNIPSLDEFVDMVYQDRESFKVLPYMEDIMKIISGTKPGMSYLDDFVKRIEPDDFISESEFSV